MKRRTYAVEIGVVVALCLILALPPASAFAKSRGPVSPPPLQGHRTPPPQPPAYPHPGRNFYPPQPHHYYGGRFHNHWPATAISLGFVFVSQPAVSSPAVVTINVPNSDGGYTAVTLTRCSGGYIGPQGEYYPGTPTVAQLQALYGGDSSTILDRAAAEAARRNAAVKYVRTTEQGWREEIVAVPQEKETGDYKLITITSVRNGKVVKEEVRKVPLDD